MFENDVLLVFHRILESEDSVVVHNFVREETSWGITEHQTVEIQFIDHE